MRLSGQRLIGMRPNGMRPNGMRPTGMRPNGMRVKGYGSRNAAQRNVIVSTIWQHTKFEEMQEIGEALWEVLQRALAEYCVVLIGFHQLPTGQAANLHLKHRSHGLL